MSLPRPPYACALANCRRRSAKTPNSARGSSYSLNASAEPTRWPSHTFASSSSVAVIYATNVHEMHGEFHPEEESDLRKFAPDARPMPLEMVIAAQTGQMQHDAPERGLHQNICHSGRRRPPRCHYLPTQRRQPATAAPVLTTATVCSHF